MQTIEHAAVRYPLARFERSATTILLPALDSLITFQATKNRAIADTAAAQLEGVLSFFTINFAFLSDNFSKRCSASACKADQDVMCDLRDSHITFPVYARAVLRCCHRLAKGKHAVFSRITFRSFETESA